MKQISKSVAVWVLYFLPLIAFSQKELSITVYGGYGFGIGKEHTLHHHYHMFELAPAGNESGKVLYSHGQGLDAGLKLNYSFARVLTATIDCSYLNGQAKKREISQSTSNRTFREHMSGAMLRVSPQLGVTLPVTDRLSIRSLLGPVFSFNSELTYRLELVGKENETWIAYRFYDDKPVGFTSTQGVRYKLGNRFKIAADLRLYVQDFTPSKGEYTHWVEMGKEKVQDLKVMDRYWEFTDEGYDIHNRTKPSQWWISTYAFHSLGVQLGVEYIIHHKSKNRTENK